MRWEEVSLRNTYMTVHVCVCVHAWCITDSVCTLISKQHMSLCT